MEAVTVDHRVRSSAQGKHRGLSGSTLAGCVLALSPCMTANPISASSVWQQPENSCRGLAIQEPVSGLWTLYCQAPCESGCKKPRTDHADGSYSIHCTCTDPEIVNLCCQVQLYCDPGASVPEPVLTGYLCAYSFPTPERSCDVGWECVFVEIDGDPTYLEGGCL
jgi:hypothetical protein